MVLWWRTRGQVKLKHNIISFPAASCCTATGCGRTDGWWDQVQQWMTAMTLFSGSRTQIVKKSVDRFAALNRESTEFCLICNLPWPSIKSWMVGWGQDALRSREKADLITLVIVGSAVMVPNFYWKLPFEIELGQFTQLTSCQLFLCISILHLITAILTHSWYNYSQRQHQEIPQIQYPLYHAQESPLSPRAARQ